MTWQSGGSGAAPIPGLTSDNENGIIVAGGITAGNPNAVAGRPSNIIFNGVVLIAGTPDPGAPLLEIDQTADTANSILNSNALFIQRGVPTTGPSITAPLLQLENDDPGATADATHYFAPLGGLGYRLGTAGGIGEFNHAPPTIPRTLAQATITAITDANTKTAVQTIANALSDRGALTLT